MFDEKGRMKGENPYIFILSRGNYEFIVASFSVLAMGGALVPLGKFMRTFFFRFKTMRIMLSECHAKDRTFYLKKPYNF